MLQFLNTQEKVVKEENDLQSFSNLLALGTMGRVFRAGLVMLDCMRRKGKG